MARRGENIYKRKDGRWEGRCVTGKNAAGKTTFSYFYGKTYIEVKRKREVYMSSHAPTQANPDKRKIFRDGTVRAWVEHWLENEVKPTVKCSTYTIYRGQIERHIYPLLGEEALWMIGKHQIETLYQSMLEKNLACTSIKMICNRFLAALYSAWEQELLEKPPKPPAKMKKDTQRKPRFLSLCEQKHLEGALNPQEIKNTKDLAVLFALYSGVRVGECCALQWGDFDMLSGGIQVARTAQRIKQFDGEKQKTILSCTEPKSVFSERFIPLPRFIAALLRQRKRQGNYQSSDFIFGKGNKPMEPRTLQHYVTRLGKTLELQGLHFHTLRHTFATRFMEKSGDVQVLKEILGHSSSRITLDWYGHATSQHIRRSMRKLDELAV